MHSSSRTELTEKKIIDRNINTSKKIVIAIDAGHGGRDSGAIGSTGLKEKKVNIAIALQLQKLLNNNKIFHAILTRYDDSYISLKKRKQFLFNNHINLLISIHANSSQKKYVSGASIWIISNSRINREINNFIKNHKSMVLFSKHIQNIFNENKYDVFLQKTILDLQSNHFQKIALDFSQYVLVELAKNIKLHKKNLNYGSLGILSCIHIPGILIETGFITNFLEEKKLKTQDYQNKIAQSLYLALNNYFLHSNFY